MSAELTQADNETTIEKTTTYHPGAGRYEPRHSVELTDPQDFADAIEAAEILGLSLTEARVNGSWDTHHEAGCSLGRGFDVEIAKAGRKWFHLRFDDGEVIRARPSSSEYFEDGTLRLLFD